MIEYFKNRPAKTLNRILLIAGILLFIPAYSSNYQLILKIMELETLNKLLLSFDTRIFSEIISHLEQQGNLGTLFNIYLLNIISTIGFGLLFTALTVMIARAVKQTSKLSKLAFIVPLLVMVIVILDILPSILFLLIAKNTGLIAGWIVYIIDISYVIRVIIIYAVMLWILIMGVYVIIKKLRSRNNS